MTKKFSRGSPLGVVLAHHKRCQADSELKDCLGDGYLFHNNRVYRNVRRMARQLGCTFTQEDFCQYNALPMAALPRILRQRRIPYSDNVTPLRELEARKPGRVRDLSWLGLLKSNYILHESGHCIADHRFRGADYPGTGLGSKQAKILRLLMCESLASTGELMGACLADSAFHRWFYSKSSYSSPFGEGISKVSLKVMDELGFQNLFKFVFYSCLNANFLCLRAGRAELARVLPLLDLAAPTGRTCERLLEIFNGITQGPNFRFRWSIAEFYINYFLDIPGDIEKLLDFDFMKAFTRNPLLVHKVNLLAAQYDAD